MPLFIFIINTISIVVVVVVIIIIMYTLVTCLYWSNVCTGCMSRLFSGGKMGKCTSLMFTCLPAEPRAPGGASEAALSQTPAGGFSSIIEGLKSNFGQAPQSAEGTSDEALVEAASKAADEAADKALQSVGSQAPDASSVAESGSGPEQAGKASEGKEPSCKCPFHTSPLHLLPAL